MATPAFIFTKSIISSGTVLFSKTFNQTNLINAEFKNNINSRLSVGESLS